MKTIHVATALILAFSFLSFTRVQRPQEIVHFSKSEVFDIDGNFDNPCTGEEVHVTGQIHVNVHGSINGNKVTTFFHYNTRSISGTGVTSGDHYAGSQTETYKDIHLLAGDRSVVAYALKLKMVSPGSGNNLILEENFHFTVNAGGTQTAVHTEGASLVCQ